MTRSGRLDILFEPAGLGSFEQIRPRAVQVVVRGVEVHVASLDDIIRSKEMANRPKDRAALPVLYALRDHQPL